jgi:hypothetical protein
MIMRANFTLVSASLSARHPPAVQYEGVPWAMALYFAPDPCFVWGRHGASRKPQKSFQVYSSALGNTARMWNAAKGLKVSNMLRKISK